MWRPECDSAVAKITKYTVIFMQSREKKVRRRITFGDQAFEELYSYSSSILSQ